MDSPVQPGETLAGKYRIERVLGVGGMGVVVAAYDLMLERKVAIKFLLGESAQNGEVVARFAREARSAVRIESEHVARVIDVGALPSGAPYMVMEYLEGNDLAHRVTAHGALPVEEAVDYVLQACEAIAEAHALGIVHRDLKPANLFLIRRADGANFIKVLDFGISKAATAAGSQPDMSLTKTSAIMGSPLYMAPEQMRSTRTVDARADVWALGVILYELVSGSVPFEATTMPELCAMVLTEAPPSLRVRCPNAPALLAAVVERCLQKDPAQRFGNVSELANALVEFAPHKSRLSAERISRVLRAAGVNTNSLTPTSAEAKVIESRPGESTAAAWSPATTGSARRTGTVGVIAVGVLVIAGAAVALILHGRGSGAEPAASAATGSMASAALSPSAPAMPSTVTAAPAPAAPPEVAPTPLALPAAASAAAPAASAAAVSATPVTPGHHAAPAAKSPKVSPASAPPPAAAPAPPPAPAPAPPAAKRNPLDIGLK